MHIAYLHEIMKLGEHSKHEHQQRDISPENLKKISFFLGISTKCVKQNTDTNESHQD